MLEKYNVNPKIRFTIREDYAIMSMVEKELCYDRIFVCKVIMIY